VTPLGLLVIAGLGLVGALLWRRLAPHLRRLPEGSTLREGVLVALAGFVGTDLLMGLALSLLDWPAPPPLGPLVTLRAACSLTVLGLIAVLLAARGKLGGLGLRRSGGPSAPLVAVAAWLAFFPVVVVVSWANAALQEALGAEFQTQQWLADFLASPDARTSPLAWVSMALALPLCEEAFFRGGLYGGLRRVLSVPLAVTISAIGFGLVHDPSYMLPTATLGAALAVLYERTGSLAAPACFHALHNGVTLAMVSAYPELAT
jgi:membrane protease YdiL (CAAX protease family)